MNTDLIVPSGSEKLKRVQVFYDTVNNWYVYIDVKKVLPKIYSKLSVENFGVTYETVTVDGPNRGVYVNTYDPSSGQLMVSSGGVGSTIYSLQVFAWYI